MVYLLYLILFPLCSLLAPEGDDTELRENFDPIISLHGVREISKVPIFQFIIVITLIPMQFFCDQLRLVLTANSFSKVFQLYQQRLPTVVKPQHQQLLSSTAAVPTVGWQVLI